jgi:diguanylate cyclase (GGDEF)-like protein/PAS domain S-box-containing protein
MKRRHPPSSPLANRGRFTIAVIVLVFSACSAFSLVVSTRAVERSQHRAALVQVMSRQRTLVERYVSEVLLARSSTHSDPSGIADTLERSAAVLLDGGTAPAIDGDDDEVDLAPVGDRRVRAQLVQARRLISDLVDVGDAVATGAPLGAPVETAHERIITTDPVQRLRVLAAITENVALNASRTTANATDRNLAHVQRLQWALAAFGALVALCLGWTLMAATRRQTAHFRALVTRSTDLLFVFTGGECCYVGDAVVESLGHNAHELLGRGCERIVHPDDLVTFASATVHGQTHQIVLRMQTKFGDWRHLEAHVSDLRADKTVRGVVLNARDVTERVRLEDELTHQAFHDGLTSLANRALFRDRLELALARSARSHELLAVLVFDLDGFKHINDSLGHSAGDEVLQQIAQRLVGISRPSDTVARLGGDEFALLLESTTEAGACGIAERVLHEIATPVTALGRPLALSASVGIAIHAGGEGDVEELMRYADVAMYAAKEAGRGRYELFRYEMARDVGEFLGMEHEMRVGLQKDEFAVHYQPMVDIETGAITGAEALLRWHSPSRGQTPPERFIPIAETTGLIHPLGEYVLRSACSQTAEWHRAGIVPGSFVMWVNVSGKQLTVGGFPTVVRSAIQDAGISPSFLGLEITENAILDDGPAGNRARADLHEMHELGIKIALDDFGTGFSSLGHLQRLPIDVIKVDRSFVDGVERDVKNAAITSNLASLAHALGLVALAEGVESDAELATVRALGCDSAQGFLFAQPASAASITEFLTTRSTVEVADAS